MSSTDARASANIRLADAELDRRKRSIHDGLLFPSVRHAMAFLWERGEAMQAPLPQHPRGQQTRTGSREYIRIGGRRSARPGNITDVHATLLTIHQAFLAAKIADPVRAAMFELHCKDGVSLSEIGKRAKRSTSMVSADIGEIEGFLLGFLQSAGVVIPARAPL